MSEMGDDEVGSYRGRMRESGPARAPRALAAVLPLAAVSLLGACTGGDADAAETEPYTFVTTVAQGDGAALATNRWTWADPEEYRAVTVRAMEVAAVQDDPCLRVADAYGDADPLGVVWPEGTALVGATGVRIDGRTLQDGSRVEVSEVEVDRAEVESSLAEGGTLACTAERFVVLLPGTPV